MGLIDVSYCPTTPYSAQSTHTFVIKGEPCVVNHTRFALVGWSRNLRNFRAAKDSIQNAALEKMVVDEKKFELPKAKTNQNLYKRAWFALKLKIAISLTPSSLSLSLS